MIPRAHITAWRGTARWATDAQVEQDLVISRALVELYRDDLLARELAFRGGTALQKLHFDPPVRYSEDIDLVQVNPGPIGPVLQAMRSCLDPWLGEPRWKQSQGRATFMYRFDSEARPVTPLKLKVEINTREHFAVLGLRRSRFVVDNPWFRGEAELLTYGPEELLGTKVRALYQRRKGRDLFDLSEALSRIPDLDTQAVVDCFLRYMEHDGLRVTRTQFELNLAAKMDDDVFLRDVPPLLASGISYEPHQALEFVQRSLISKLPEGTSRGRKPGAP
ncbi:MAG: nucleotidyl transferase AbiEii/AbiGii toxin family protein [Krumholzibacteria bacterium]|nr:nucleotidyl transferase AbiEii/AbiGii toxin family protein [Candidatus Krumholzibacteria bacterium]